MTRYVCLSDFKVNRFVLKNIDNWLTANKLSLDFKNTKYMLFSASSSNETSKKLLLTIRGKLIEKFLSIKLLEVICSNKY